MANSYSTRACTLEEARTRRLQEARERRHRAATNPVPINDEPASRIGLVSHMRAHQRRREAGQTVIVGHDGLP